MRRPQGQAWLVRLCAAALLTCAFGYVPFHLYKKSGFEKYLQLRQDLAALEARNERLRGEIAHLAREAEMLKNDPRAVEHVARHELGWVEPGDILIDRERRPRASASASGAVR